jgi:hypothetical protein
MAKTVSLKKLKKEINRWPKSWAGFDSDIPLGQLIIDTMQTFLLAMLEDRLSYTSINRHVGNLWLLGGEIISRAHKDSELKGLDGKQLILRFVDETGGPYSRHLTTEEEQRAFDATCKKLYRFLRLKP